MKNDIRDRKDIQLLVDKFYEKVRSDDTIGYIFNDVAKVDWPHHLPRMYDFWENIAFQTGGYSGNPMPAHMQLHQQTRLTAAHFERWLQLFTGTADELFEGDKTELVKQRALSIATMMRIKIINDGISD